MARSAHFCLLLKHYLPSGAFKSTSAKHHIQREKERERERKSKEKKGRPGRDISDCSILLATLSCYIKAGSVLWFSYCVE